MGELKSRIILSKNIHIDKEYVNVLDYTESQMLELLQDNNHYVNSRDDYRFIRQNESIFVDFSYSECIQANYIAFQNKDYDNKWFFAWIDEVIYQSDASCELKYTIDSWSTWFDKWNAKTCFVAREHVNDDAVGKHTLPENLNIGQLIADKVYTENVIGAESYFWFVIACNYDPNNNERYAGIGLYGNYPQGSMWFAWLINNSELSDHSDLNEVNEWVYNITKDGHAGDIQTMFALPYQAFSLSDVDATTHMVQLAKGNKLNTDINYSKSTIRTFEDYTPKNKKLLTYPYSFLRVTNNAGSFNDYKIEDFHVTDVDGNETDDIVFNAIGVPCQGYSGKLRPREYQGVYYNEDESIALGKYPTLSWSSDGFTNWLTANAINLAVGAVNTAVSGATSLAKGNIVDGVSSIATQTASMIGSIHQASMIPNTAKGNANAGDLSFSHNLNRFKIMHMRPKKEYLEIVDDYFTRFGYAINRVKIPNIKGRKIFNYIEIGGSESVGSGTVPAKHMDIINKACRKGVTIWHNHANVGNYSLDNTL